MKYVLILVAVVVIARIDFFLSLFSRASDKLFSQTDEETGGTAPANPTKRDIISFKNDKTLKQTPKGVLISLLNDFTINPSKENRLKALALIQTNPALVTAKLDTELEAVLYQWRDLVVAKNGETFQFLLDLQKILPGENQVMVKKLTSLLMDTDIDYFMKYYVFSKDFDCSIVTLLADNLPDEERLNEFYDRERLLNTYLQKDIQDLTLKNFATNCQASLRIHLDRITPPPVPDAPPTDESQTEPPAEESL